MAPYPMHDSAVSPCFHDYLTFLPRHFQPQSPPSHPLNPSLHSQQQPSHWDCSSIPKLQVLATAPSRGSTSLFVVCMAVERKDCLILIPFWLPQSWCFTVRLKCFSSDSDNCPDVGIRALLQFHHWLRAGPVLLTLLFLPLVPSSHPVLPGSTYSFPLIRSSCLLLAGVLHALMCLKVYFWCIHGERCTPCPPTPPPSCSLYKKAILTGACAIDRKVELV